MAHLRESTGEEVELLLHQSRVVKQERSLTLWNHYNETECSSGFEIESVANECPF